MFNAQELRGEIARLLAKVRQENAALQQSCTEFPSEDDLQEPWQSETCEGQLYAE